MRLPFRRRDKVEIWQGADGQWYWHRKSPNGLVVGDGGGYSRRDSALRGVFRANRGGGFTVVVLEEAP